MFAFGFSYSFQRVGMKGWGGIMDGRGWIEGLFLALAYGRLGTDSDTSKLDDSRWRKGLAVLWTDGFVLFRQEISLFINCILLTLSKYHYRVVVIDLKCV